MIVQSISDYLTVGGKVLHLKPDELDGASFQAMHDCSSLILTIHMDEIRKDDLGLRLLLKAPIEFAVYEKKGNVLPMVKIGFEDPYILTIPFNPVDPNHQGALDLFHRSRFLTICFAEGYNEKMEFRGIRIVGIPLEAMTYVVERWIKALEQASNYSIKYLNFMNDINNSGKSVEQLWDEAVKLGELEE